ncbi:MAG: mechanosensitive ion channel domain-containing protein [Acidimicrobiia bacterium]
MIRFAYELGSIVVITVAGRFLISALLGKGRVGATLDEGSRKTITKSLTMLVAVVSAVVILSGRSAIIRQDLLLATIAFMPKLVVGVMVFIVSFVLSRLAGVIVEQSMRQRSPVLATRMKGLVAGSIIVIGILLALKQMGMETDVLMLVLGGVIATATIAGGLAIGLGSLPLARNIAAGRHVEDRFRIGQRIDLGEVSGRLSEVHLASVKLIADDGSGYEVPHTLFLDVAVKTSED